MNVGVSVCFSVPLSPEVPEGVIYVTEASAAIKADYERIHLTKLYM